MRKNVLMHRGSACIAEYVAYNSDWIPPPTTGRIAWGVVAYVPLSALCMEAFFEVLPHMLPTEIFTQGFLLALAVRVGNAKPITC